MVRSCIGGHGSAGVRFNLGNRVSLFVGEEIVFPKLGVIALGQEPGLSVRGFVWRLFAGMTTGAVLRESCSAPIEQGLIAGQISLASWRIRQMHRLDSLEETLQVRQHGDRRSPLRGLIARAANTERLLFR